MIYVGKVFDNNAYFVNYYQFVFRKLNLIRNEYDVINIFFNLNGVLLLISIVKFENSVI